MEITFLSGEKPIHLDALLPADRSRPHPAILLLHGSGGNLRFWMDRLTPFIEVAGVAVFAVRYFDATGTVRASTPEFTDGVHVPAWFQAIRDALAHIRQMPEVDPGRLALLGISLGAFLALGIGTEAPPPGAPPLRAIIDISGGLLPPWDQAATASFPPTLILHGDADTTVSVDHAHRLDALLGRLGVPHRTVILPGEGHWFSTGAQRQMLSAIAEFLAQHLQASLVE